MAGEMMRAHSPHVACAPASRGRGVRLRLATVAAVATIAVTAACGTEDGAATTAYPALPPGMGQLPSNADAPPPAVPFASTTPLWRTRVVHGYPHDTLAYTQGLLVHEGRLFESTGQEGRSTIREVNLATGTVVRQHRLAPRYFGEGIAVVGDRLYQLTWKHGRGYVYDMSTLAPVDSFTYEGEGWGLTSDGQYLYMSDGSSRIRVVDPNGFRVIRSMQVTEDGRPVHALNELEWMDGQILANVYQTDYIARIDPATGLIEGWIHLHDLLTYDEAQNVEVPNGVAWDSAGRRLFVTGKLWPRLFHVELDSIR